MKRFRLAISKDVATNEYHVRVHDEHELIYFGQHPASKSGRSRAEADRNLLHCFLNSLFWHTMSSSDGVNVWQDDPGRPDPVVFERKRRFVYAFLTAYDNTFTRNLEALQTLKPKLRFIVDSDPTCNALSQLSSETLRLLLTQDLEVIRTALTSQLRHPSSKIQRI